MNKKNLKNPKNGTYTDFYKNGKKRVEQNYKDNLNHGKSTMWFAINDQKSFEVNFVNGTKEGREINWYSNGQKDLETNYKNGNKHGKETYWSRSGDKIKEINYKNNLLDGEFNGWFGDGTKKYEASYILGVKEGKFKTWYWSNLKRSEEVFKTDVIQGIPKYWYPNGNEKTIDVVEAEARSDFYTDSFPPLKDLGFSDDQEFEYFMNYTGHEYDHHINTEYPYFR